jgi:hypothetical protein
MLLELCVSRLLAASLSPRRPEFDPGSVRVGFVMDKTGLGENSHRELKCCLVSIFLPMLCTNAHHHTALIIRADVQRLETSSVHVCRYSPFWALAPLKRCLHSSLSPRRLLQPCNPRMSNASLWSTSCHLFLGFPTDFCSGISH